MSCTHDHDDTGMTRRMMLRSCSTGFGMVALASLLGAHRAGRTAAKAKSVIFCYMSGGVSQVDSFDPKPRLAKEADRPMPMPVERTQFNQNGKIRPSPWRFSRYGESGLEVSELFPHTGAHADKLAVIRSMTSSFNEHAQGNFFMHTGFPVLGHPGAGAWISYGLGNASENLPAHVVLRSGGSGIPHGGVGLFDSAFLPAVHQASILNAEGRAALRNLRARAPRDQQRARLDLVRALDEAARDRLAGARGVEAAIASYEMGFRMQRSVPELVSLAGESSATRKLYGLDATDPKQAGYARQCLLARRLVERGVRFVELTCLSYDIGGGNAANPWDQHSDLERGHGRMARQVDQPIGALLHDLESRGLLDTTLVIWAGEFGRTPFSQGANGRDHNPQGFTIWLAGGGVRGGVVYGATDEYGYHAVEKKCTVYDLWATVLHQLGLDHRDLTYRHGGRDLRLTDVHGTVLAEVLS